MFSNSVWSVLEVTVSQHHNRYCGVVIVKHPGGFIILKAFFFGIKKPIKKFFLISQYMIATKCPLVSTGVCLHGSTNGCYS